MKALKEINELYVDDFFHIMHEIALADYADIYLSSEWYDTFNRITREEAGTPLSKRDKQILIKPLRKADAETLEDLLSLLA